MPPIGAKRVAVFGNKRAPVRAIGTRTRIFDGIDTARQEYMTESYTVVTSDTDVFGIATGGYYVGADCAEIGAGSDGLTTASVYRAVDGPAAQERITWGGQITGVVSNLKNVESDLIPLKLKKGDGVFVRQWCRFPGGVPVNLDTVKSGIDISYRGTTTADLTMISTAMSAGGPAARFPFAVLGRTNDNAEGIIGNSRTYGRNDTYDSTYEIGELCRAIGQSRGYINVARRTMSIRQFLASNSLRMELLKKYCTRIWLNLAVNDFYNEGKSVDQVKALMASLWASMPPGMPIYQTTITPLTGGAWSASDGSDQIIPSGDPINSINTWLRAGGFSSFQKLVDHAQVVQLAGNPSKWHPLWTDDGLHDIQVADIAIRDSGIIQAAAV